MLIPQFACVDSRPITKVRAAICQDLPKTWSAKDGATEPYRDVFTGVFRKVLADSRMHKCQIPRQEPLQSPARPRFSFELQETPV
ncbi:hypothetical protein D0851_10095 [Marinobacter sp. Arc7-DN-1]|nr:hypothetical protein D0851_10095 [Marinobacter sp. Arc7-DN-1]